MRNPRFERRITAFHEAGHAVIAFRFGIPVDSVVLCDTGPVLGYVALRRKPMVSTALDDDTALPPWPIVVRETEQRVMMLLAGPLAEARLLAAPLRAHGCISDLRKCESLCRALHEYRARLVVQSGARIPNIDPAALANRLRSRTARMLARPNIWRATAALAAELEAWRHLSGADAADTAQWAQRLRNQLALSFPTSQSAETRRKPRSLRRNVEGFAGRPVQGLSLAHLMRGARYSGRPLDLIVSKTVSVAI